MNDRQEAGAATASGAKLFNGRWGLAASFLIVCVLSAIASESARPFNDANLPERMANPSTFNERASGLSGLFEIAGRSGVDARRWLLPYRRLRGLHGTLVVVGPERQFNNSDCLYLNEWVSAGNAIVYLDDFSFGSGAQLLHLLGLGVATRQPITDAHVVPAPIPETQYVKGDGLVVSADMRIKGGAAIAEDGAGTLLACTKRGAGGGRVLVGSMPNLCANERLGDEREWSNFQFLINWFQTCPGPIYFDERCHGFSSLPNMYIYLAKTPLGYIVAQLLLIALLAAAGAGQRFGQKVPVPVSRHISNLEFVDGLADVLVRARATDAAWTMLFVPFHARLCKKAAAAPDADAATLAAAWSECTGQPVEPYKRFLERAERAMNTARLPRKEFLQLVRSLDELSGGTGDLSGAGRIRGT